MLTVIGTSPGREAWAADALASVPGEAIVVSVPGYELGKLEWVVENTTVERFLFIQDSVLVTPQLFELLNDYDGSVALLGDPRPYGCFLGVYTRHALLAAGFAPIRTKLEAVEAELWWTGEYRAAAGKVPVLFPELTDRNAEGPIERHGRPNLVLSNSYMTKFKGTWKWDQIAT